MTDLAVYAGLFMAALVAATIFPMQSEAALAGLALAGYSPALLLIVASIGNILGSVINWMLGRGIEHFRDRSWFPATPAALAPLDGRDFWAIRTPGTTGSDLAGRADATDPGGGGRATSGDSVPHEKPVRYGGDLPET